MDKKKRVLEAISEMYADTSMTKEQCRDALQEIIEEIEVLIDALDID
jgi:exonuclease VII small subunit